MPINFLDNNEEEDFFERPEIKSILLTLIGVCCFCFVLVVSSDRWIKQNAVENFKEYKIVGKITVKALDYTGRKSPYLIVKQKKEYVSELIWDNTDVGDSIYKERDTDAVKIIKRDTVITITAEEYQRHLDSTFVAN
ncbi:hypothetical protein FMM05_17685 [Flavobacterium zepuense]|uniref:Uncharacterized protein n=1 Tax=Flavobacterium zepuense TaxID=2593302 RepID=A0A552UVV3_9FLAO|nr:hypothetical protein [Flavobacterium zepuense]TRW22337.1 hypothetical protein FMM05_17685 [Flavobacterium zepuense]